MLLKKILGKEKGAPDFANQQVDIASHAFIYNYAILVEKVYLTSLRTSLLKQNNRLNFCPM